MFLFYLTITNKAAINIYIQVLCKHKFSPLWDECLGIQLIVDIIVQGLHFQETVKVFYRVTISFCIPINNVCVIQLPTCLPELV